VAAANCHYTVTEHDPQSLDGNVNLNSVHTGGRQLVVTNRDGLPTHRWSLISVLTLCVAQLCLLRPLHYH